ncbi:hypothetical protein VU04_03135, partial [Desulfobulbus sp. TB]|nr:hypothetical protein [Desulfobulbus sp. TB]
TELAQEVLEQSIACLGFTPDPTVGGGKILQGNGSSIFLDAGAVGFWRKYSDQGVTKDRPTDGDHDFCFPYNGTDCLGGPRTNVALGGNTRLTSGAAIQQAAGYEGRGKALASGGARLLYDIKTQNLGRDNSESVICVNYEHILGSEGDCYY